MKCLLELISWGVAQLKNQRKSLLLIAIFSICLFFVIKLFGIEENARELLDFSGLSFKTKALIGLGLFVWSCVLFTTFMPLGTATVLLAGYVLGPAAGLIQFGSMLISTVFLYRVFEQPDKSYRIENYTQNSTLLKLFDLVSDHSIWTVSLLRIIPVIPSAACVFISRILCIRLKDMIIGTLFVGWIRPVFFAFLGSQVTRLTF